MAACLLFKSDFVGTVAFGLTVVSPENVFNPSLTAVSTFSAIFTSSILFNVTGITTPTDTLIWVGSSESSTLTVDVDIGGTVYSKVASSNILVYRYPLGTSDISMTIKGPSTLVTNRYVIAAESLELPNVTAPLSPPNIARNYSVRNNVNRNGVLVGNNLFKKPVPLTITMKNLTQDWVEANVPNVTERVSKSPFFFMRDPDNKPDQVAYCWLDKEVSQPRLNKNGLYDWQIQCQSISQLT